MQNIWLVLNLAYNCLRFPLWIQTRHLREERRETNVDQGGLEGGTETYVHTN